MNIQDGVVVGMHYTLKNYGGDTLDTSKGQDPMVFLYGFGNIIEGLEKAMAGKAVGDAFHVTVEPEDGYGVRDDALQQSIARSDFEGIDDIQVGMRFLAETEDGPVPIRVVAIEDDKITVDGNHELAGERLHFSVSIESVREAEAEEIQHGHVHGPGGHDH
ncbi:TPA: peptidylprolyl isomerase [Candidatus Latescibacteria bacterium]|nr:peptidylprolyl isomerase [Candidatus Latescibacterota bacterium]